MRVGVVGAGAVGLACGYALREAGAEVIVLERDSVGGGASAGNAGWVTPSMAMPLAGPGMLSTGLRSALDPRGALVIRPTPDLSWLRWLWQFRRSCSPERYRDGVRALAWLTARSLEQLDRYRDTGVALEIHETGILAVARSAHGLDWFESLHRELVASGLPVGFEPIGGDEARVLEPALGPAVDRALFAALDRYVRPETLTSGLAAHLAAHGVAVLEGEHVRALKRGGDAWVVETTSETHRCDAVVVATGASASELLRPLGVRLPVVGATGYSVTVRGGGTAPSRAVYLCEPKIGLSPFGDELRIAGIFELPGRTPRPSARRVAQLLDEAVLFLRDWRPGPAASLGEGWAGLRPATPDSLPLLGQVPSHDGLYVAAGHGMLGITLAPATGALMADLIVRGSSPPELRAFAPGRKI